MENLSIEELLRGTFILGFIAGWLVRSLLAKLL